MVDTPSRRRPSSPSSPRAHESPNTVEEALENARNHAQNAAAEALLAARASLDALSLAFGEQPARESATFGSLARGLDELALQLSDESRSAWGSLVRGMLDALDGEIDRWETRSREDGDARAVLRAFLGLREVLWEAGVRRGEAAPASAPTPSSDEPTPPAVRILRSTAPPPK